MTLKDVNEVLHVFWRAISKLEIQNNWKIPVFNFVNEWEWESLFQVEWWHGMDDLDTHQRRLKTTKHFHQGKSQAKKQKRKIFGYKSWWIHFPQFTILLKGKVDSRKAEKASFGCEKLVNLTSAFRSSRSDGHGWLRDKSTVQEKAGSKRVEIRKRKYIIWS